VTFAVGGRSRRFDLTVPRGVYQAQQGWSGELDGTAQAHSTVLNVGAVSDGDSLLERFAGMNGSGRGPEGGLRPCAAGLRVR